MADAADPNALLVVIHVLSGRHFRQEGSDCTFVRIKFNDSLQETDAKRGATPKWDQDLVWELSDAQFKQLRTNRAAVKLECFNGPSADARPALLKKMGYLVVPLHEIRLNDQLCRWVPLLQPAQTCRPELQLRMRLMRADDYYRQVQAAAEAHAHAAAEAGRQLQQQQAQQQQQQQQQQQPSQPLGVDDVLAAPEVIEIGTPGGIEVRFNVTITSVRRLEALTHESFGSLYLYFQLFGIDHRAPLPRFGQQSTELRRSFVLRSSRSDLSTFFEEMPLEVYVCSGSTAIGRCEICVSPLVSQWLACDGRKPQALVEAFAVLPVDASKKSGDDQATMGVTLELDCDSSPECPLPADVAPETRVVKYEESPMASLKSALHQQAVASMTLLQTSPIRSSSECDDKLLEPSNALMMLDYTMTSSDASESCGSIAPHCAPAHGTSTAVDGPSTSSSSSSSSSGGSGSSSSSVAPPPRKAPSSVGPEYAKLYRVCIELSALKALLPSHVLRAHLGERGDVELPAYLADAANEEVWLYTRFEYPMLFGSAHIYSNPTPYVQRTNDGRALTIVGKPELGGGTFSFEFAMSERNLAVALRQCSIAVEVWRMSHPPHVAHAKVAQQHGEDEFVGVAVVPLSAMVGLGAKRQSIGDGEVVFGIHSYFPVLPELPGVGADDAIRQPCVGHVGVRLQLSDLGPFEVARSRDMDLREQLETTRAKCEQLWEERNKLTKRVEKLSNKLLVADFEDQVRDRQDLEEQRQCLKRLQAAEKREAEQRQLNREAIEMLELAEKAAVQEQCRAMALKKENDELKARMAQLSAHLPSTPDRVRPLVKRVQSIASPLVVGLKATPPAKRLLDKENAPEASPVGAKISVIGATGAVRLMTPFAAAE